MRFHLPSTNTIQTIIFYKAFPVLRIVVGPIGTIFESADKIISKMFTFPLNFARNFNRAVGPPTQKSHFNLTVTSVYLGISMGYKVGLSALG